MITALSRWFPRVDDSAAPRGGWAATALACALVSSAVVAVPAWAQDAPDAGETADETPAEGAEVAPGEGADDPPLEGTVLKDDATDDAVGAVPPEELPGLYLRELRGAEEEVHALKERAFRSRSTLQLLQELVLDGAGLGAGLEIVHVHELPRSYHVEEIRYYLDGKPIWTWQDTEEDAAPPPETDVRSTSVPSGSHTLQVMMRLRGRGGLFKYVDDYTFEVRSNYTFDVEDGRSTVVKVRSTTEGNRLKGYEKRPNVLYETRVEQVAAE